RRDRRHLPRPPGEAPPRAPGAVVRARRRDRDADGRRPRGRRDEPGPEEAGGRRKVPRGPLLPAERDHDHAAAAARAEDRHPSALRAFPPPAQGGRPVRARNAGGPRAVRLAGQRAPAAQCDRTGRRARRRRRDFARRPAPRGPAVGLPSRRFVPRAGRGVPPPAHRRDPRPLRRQSDPRRRGPEAPAHLPGPPHPPARNLTFFSGTSRHGPASKGRFEEVAMKTILATVMSLLVAGSVYAQNDGPERGKVDVVFCVDRSGSMDQVIETAKRKIWTIVNEVAKQKPTPILRIGLIGYGSADKDIKFFP